MSGNTILVIEDEADIRDMLSFALERAGYVVSEARDAEEALSRLDGPLPDLVIIDWMLPGMSGLDLARRLRRDALTADLPLVMLTAKGQELDRATGEEVGADLYLTKPFDPDDVLERAAGVLGVELE